MNKKIKNLLAVFVLSLCVVLYLNNKERGNVSNDDREFVIQDLADVSAISLSIVNGKQVTLQLINDQWTVNKGLIRTNKIDDLIKVATRLKVKNRVASPLVDSLLVEIKNTAISIKFMDEEDVLLSYKVLVNNNAPHEIIVLSEGDHTPYYAHVFGEEINFSSLFTSEITSWSSLVIADYTGVKVTEVCTNSFHNKDGSFCVLANDSLIKYSCAGESLEGLNLRKGINYLRSFKQIVGTKMFSNSKVFKELLGGRNPFFEIKVSTVKEVSTFTAYRKQAGLKQVDFAGKPLEFDNEYFYLKANHNLYLMDYFSFEELMKTAKDFSND